MTARIERPPCFGQLFSQGAPECVGGLDPGYYHPINNYQRDPCHYWVTCKERTMQNANEMMQKAIENTPAEYWMKVCGQRAGKSEAVIGSRFPRRSAEEVDRFIRGLMWEPYTHVNVVAPCQAFIARSTLEGLLGVMRLADVPEDAELVWDDAKNTGKVEVIWKGGWEKAKPIEVDFTVAIIGPDGDNQVVYSFFPGDPINPSKVDRKYEGVGLQSFPDCDRHCAKVTKAEAAKLGVEWVKLG